MMKRLLFAFALGAMMGCDAKGPTSGADGSDRRAQSMEGGHSGHASPSGGVSETSPSASASPSEQLHALMTRPMRNMRMSGNVDRDFATMMAEHHEQAIEMVNVFLAHSKNAHLREMAEKMRESQTRERDRLLEIIREVPSGEAAGKASEASNRMHEAMMRSMRDMRLTGDVDRDFSAMMAEHHQGAIDMAKIELTHGKNAELKRMARQIVDDQQKEREMLLSHAADR